MNNDMSKQSGLPLHERVPPAAYKRFKEHLCAEMKLTLEAAQTVRTTPASKLYTLCPVIGISEFDLAKEIARFLQIPFISEINPEEVVIGAVPLALCKEHQFLVVKFAEKSDRYIFSNPFNWDVLDMVDSCVVPGHEGDLSAGSPETIRNLLQSEYLSGKKGSHVSFNPSGADKFVISTKQEEQALSGEGAEMGAAITTANTIIQRAVAERASDIHIEPKENKTVVRYRIDGEMCDIYTLQKLTGVMVISRFKALSGLDIAEKRRPQDGSIEAVLDGKPIKMRIATTSTPFGESLIARVLDMSSKPRGLEQLGMTDDQVRQMIDLSNHTQGMILVVGPTGSGKTTTIYSLLLQIDCKSRSLLSVEDPVEYNIPYANQQQANEKAGVTFDILVKSAVRQDPDILFLGEIRDQESAKIAVDFASTGHMTISTLHTSNATTALFRLERLGVKGSTMADSVLAVIAQRLVKKLCDCKKIEDITSQETALLSQFTDDIPKKVARPVGCPKCKQTGYAGRVGVYEILQFDKAVAQMIRESKPIAEIRQFVQGRGNYLLSNHALDHVRNLFFTPQDAYDNILVEEIGVLKNTQVNAKEATAAPVFPPRAQTAPVAAFRAGTGSLLVVEDDPDTRALIQRILQTDGYAVTVAGDGIEALLMLGKEQFDIILSDVRMPHLDGFKLLEMITQKGIQTPVVFLTGSVTEEDETKGLEMGAIDFMKKPIKKEVLLIRIKNILGKLRK